MLNKSDDISRLKTDVVVYRSQESQEPLDLARFLKKHIVNGLIDMKVFIGKEKHPHSLVLKSENIDHDYARNMP